MAFKRANGSGSVCKLKGKKRRKPWRVRITLGWEVNEDTGKSKQVLKLLGDYESRAEADMALIEYKSCPYDLGTKNLTFQEVYELWSSKYFNKLTASAQRTVTAAYRYCFGLYHVRMRDIRSHHLKECMEQGYIIPTEGKEKGKKRFASPSTKGRMKSMFNLLFDFAYENDMVDKNYARTFTDEDNREEEKRQRREVVPFTEDEIKMLWNHVEKLAFVDMILIGIYSGWRPQELAILKVADIDLENFTFKGGLKTDAGKNRIVPIHSVIKELVLKRLEEARELNSNFLFNDEDGQQGTHLTYDKYRKRFEKVMNRLDMKHRPHETRHTFTTKAKRACLDEHILKKVVGHADNDITESVYTHRKVEDLIREMEKIER